MYNKSNIPRQWIRRTLTEEELVVNESRGKYNFTERDLTRVLITVWTQDDISFIPELYRALQRPTPWPPFISPTLPRKPVPWDLLSLAIALYPPRRGSQALLVIKNFGQILKIAAILYFI